MALCIYSFAVAVSPYAGRKPKKCESAKLGTSVSLRCRGLKRKRLDSANVPIIALIGNPNTGKTTLFNRLTGQNARVGNYPGMTVERRTARASFETEGRIVEAELLDVPGAYSLSARSAEEKVAIDSLLGMGGNPQPRLAVLVLDATQLIRNLYLALQVIELGVPTVLALNMIDEVRGSAPDHQKISALFKVPCVAISAKSGEGLDELRRTIGNALLHPPIGKVGLRYPQSVDEDASQVRRVLPETWRSTPGHRHDDTALALWALTSIDEDDELDDIPGELRECVLGLRRGKGKGDIDTEIITTRYAFLDRSAKEFHRPTPPNKPTERLDRVLLHPVFGFVIFLALMGITFQALFAWADPAIAAIEHIFGALGSIISRTLPGGFLTDLLVDGIIGGVGNVVVFLPQILLLFFLLGLMEDSGYMARVAYLMDRIMRSLGLHGRAFVPMLSGYACAIPAIMATRTMERHRDRMLTMMVIPLMTCSARLPVYTLIIASLFPPSTIFGWVPVQGLLMVGMYLFSTTVALIAAGVLGRTVFKGPTVPLILELPPYRMPVLQTVARMMWQRSRLFLSEAGTIILLSTVVLWALLNFPQLPQDSPATAGMSTVERKAASMEYSIGGRIGKAIEPAIAPLGFDWKIGVGLIGAFTAREVFVSTMGLIYGVGGDASEESVSLRDRMRDDKHHDGRPVYTPLVGLTLMVFFALACQCTSTLAVVKRETGGWRWPAFLFAYMSVLAWCSAFAVYQGGLLLGFGT